MRRVLVMGCSGAGKTTFARALAARLGVPYVSLDGLFWQPGWREPVTAEFDARVAAEAERPAWVIDGNFLRHAGEARRARADTVVWFDLPRHTCLAGVLWRLATSYGKVRPESAPGCPECLDWAFLRYIWNFRRTHRPGLMAYLAERREDQRLVVFVHRREADAFLRTAGAA